MIPQSANVKYIHRSSADEHMYALDLLRFLAALAVAVHHWGWVAPMDVKILSLYPGKIDRYGNLGVELFFLISGFVILMSARQASLREFIVARMVRLYPAFLICCTLTALIWTIDPLGPTWAQYIVNLTMFPRLSGVTPMDGVYWTLVLEAKFYILIALLIIFHLMPKVEMILWVWLVISVVTISSTLRTFFMSEYVAFFVGGCACYLLRDKQTAGRWLLFAASIFIGISDALDRAQHQTIAHKFPYEPILVGCIISSFFALVLAISLGWLRLPASRHIAVLGAMSYPLYLLHMRIGYLFFSWGERLPGLSIYFATLTWVLLMSWVVYSWGERPVQQWLRARLREPTASPSEALP